MDTYMDDLKKTVSHSEIEAFLLCERKHFYQYGMKLHSITPSEALARGTFGHAALEIAFNHCLETGEPLSEGIDVAIGWIGEQMLADHTLTYANAVLRCLLEFKRVGGLSGFTPLAVEIRENAPMGPDMEMSLVIDLIVRDEAGLVGVIDHKFLSRAYYGDQTELMPQLARYIVALRNLGYPVDWVAYSEFMVTSGKWEFQWIETSEAKIARVELEHIEASRRILARRFEVLSRGEEGLLDWSDQALRVFNTMVCDRCPMKKLCIAELNQENVQLTLDTYYRVKESNDPGLGPLEPVSGSDEFASVEGA